MADLAGRRVLVVGASAGIGRAVVRRAVAAGARVVASARRADALAAIVDEAGGGTAVAADVCDHRARRALVAAAAEALGGGIDLVVSSVGYADLRPLADTGEDAWHATLEANVVGFNLLVRELLPLLAPGAVVAALSSETAGAPRHGLVPYAAAKAALEASLRGWRAEQPAVRFTCVVVGATQPSEFGADFGAVELDWALTSWVRHGVLQEEFMHTDDVAAVLVDTLATALAAPGVGVETLVLRSPSPVAGAAWTHGSASSRGPTRS